MTAWIALIVIGLALLWSALQVVVSRNLVYSVFWLAVMLVSTAALYVTLAAPFIAAIQVILYAGGVITLMLFGVMLTRRHDGITVPNPSQHRLAGAVTSVALLALFLTAIWKTTHLGGPVEVGDAALVGAGFLTEHLLAFEVLSVLLLAAMIGAIVLTRTRDA